jgi:ribosome biogenesis protein YTM1
LLGGEFVRTSLRQHLLARQLTTEAVHEVEYVEAIPAPAPLSDFEHDDWVSSVHGAAPGVFLTASYDRHVRVWSAADKSCLIDIPDAHAGIVKCVRWISFDEPPVTDNDDNDAAASAVEPPQSGTFASSGDDHVIKVWECSPTAGTFRPLYQFEGHTGAIDRVCIEPSRKKLCSASWDGDLRIWDLEMAASAAASAPSGKRRRTAGGKQKKGDADDDSSDDADALNTCIAVLSGHNGRVSSAVWPTFDRIYSVGWDCSVRAWDAETHTNVTTLTGPVPVHDISYSMPTGLVATAHSDRSVRVWDPRTTTTIIQKTLTSHKQWVSSVLWHPYSSSLLLSASYDNTVKMWDIRSSIPLFTIAAHSDKVLCVDWCGAEVFVSGGADRKLFVHGSQSTSTTEEGEQK